MKLISRVVVRKCCTCTLWWKVQQLCHDCCWNNALWILFSTYMVYWNQI